MQGSCMLKQEDVGDVVNCIALVLVAALLSYAVEWIRKKVVKQEKQKTPKKEKSPTQGSPIPPIPKSIQNSKRRVRLEGNGRGRKRGDGLRSKKKDKAKNKVVQNRSAKGRLEDQIGASPDMDTMPDRIGICRFAKQRRLKKIRRQKFKTTAENEGWRAKCCSAKMAVAEVLAAAVTCFSVPFRVIFMIASRRLGMMSMCFSLFACLSLWLRAVCLNVCSFIYFFIYISLICFMLGSLD